MRDRTRNERENRQSWEVELRLRISNVPVGTREDWEVSEGAEGFSSQTEMIEKFPATQKSLT